MTTVFSDRIEILSRGSLAPEQTMEGFFAGESVPESEGKSYYINGNRNGTSKQLYTNPGNEIEEFLRLVDGFWETEDKITAFIRRKIKCELKILLQAG